MHYLQAQFQRRLFLAGALFALVLLGVPASLLLTEETTTERDVQGRTPLIQAAEQGDIRKVSDLLEAEADVQAVDNCGWTAFMKAGADPAHADRSGHTAGDLAVEAGHQEVLPLIDTPSTSL